MSEVTAVVTCLDFLNPVFRCQRQGDAVSPDLDLSDVFVLVFRNLLEHRLNSAGDFI
jgi:hypothetical protein